MASPTVRIVMDTRLNNSSKAFPTVHIDSDSGDGGGSKGGGVKMKSACVLS